MSRIFLLFITFLIILNIYIDENKYQNIFIYEHYYYEIDPICTNEKEEWIDLTEEEKYMLAALIKLEAGGSSFECQSAICSVILNRLENGRWGNTLEDVIYAPLQFSPAHKIPDTTPNDEQINIVENICKNGPTIPKYVLYFRADYFHSWEGMIDYCYIDTTYFSYSINDYIQYTTI